MSAIVIPESFDLELVNGNLKAAMKGAGAGSSDLWHVQRSFIRVLPGFNVRLVGDPDYQAHIEALAYSIEQNGYAKDKPLTGFVAREDGVDFICLTDGHSRLAAVDLLEARGLEIGPLPMVVKPRGTSREDMTFDLVTGNSGRPLTPYEVALVCKRLMGYGVEDKVIAKRLNLSPRYLQDLLHLVGAPIKIRDMVISGQVSATTAIETLKEHGNKAGSVLKLGLDRAIESGKTRVTQKHINAASPTPASNPKPKDHLKTIGTQIEPLIQAWHALGPDKRNVLFQLSVELGVRLDAIQAALEAARAE
jgi:ParB family chromosome partitioning protein